MGVKHKLPLKFYTLYHGWAKSVKFEFSFLIAHRICSFFLKSTGVHFIVMLITTYLGNFKGKWNGEVLFLTNITYVQNMFRKSDYSVRSSINEAFLSRL